jgi:hypothetical protein
MVLTCLSVGIVSASAAEGLTVTGTSNYFDSFSKVVNSGENKVTVAFAIKSDKDLLNAEWYLTYDNTKLEFIDDDNMDIDGDWTIMPYVPNAVINTDVGNRHDTICGNVSSVSLAKISSTDKPKSFVSVTFEIIGTGTANVDLQLRNLTLGTKDPSTGLLDPDTEEVAVVLYETATDSTSVKSSSAVVYEGYYDESNIPDDSTPEDSSLTFKSYSLSLASNIEMNFNVAQSTLEGYTDPYIVVSVGNEKTTISDYTVSGTNYVFKYNKIYPQLIGDDITAVLHATKNGSEKYGPEYTRSVKGYCTNMFKYDHTTYAKFHTLLVNLLNYGAQAQTYIGYNTSNLCNKDLTATQKSWALTDLGTLNSVRNMNAEPISNPTVTFNAASLSLGSTVGITMYFTTDNIANKTIVATVSGNEYSFTSEDFEPVSGYTNRYKLTFSDLYANDMRKTVTFRAYQNGTLVSNTATYSIESYVAAHTNDGNTVANLINAMYLYGEAAKAYAG